MMKWVTANKEEIEISDLDDRHLSNILAFLARQAPTLKLARELGFILATSAPCGPRGDMASEAVDLAQDDLSRSSWPDHLPEITRELADELTRRGLPIPAGWTADLLTDVSSGRREVGAYDTFPLGTWDAVMGRVSR